MKINILSLYSDILNLYGDTGNLKVLKYHLDNLKVDYNIDYLSIDDEIDFKKYNLVIIGSGTENNRELALNHLLKYKKEVNDAIENNTFFLVTGNSLAMFGEELYDKKALDIFDLEIEKSDERITEEKVLKSKYSNDIYGLVNHSDDIDNDEENLFDTDGIKYKNFYGTYLIGPLLVKNPSFLEYFLKELLNKKDLKLNLDLDTKAYNEYIEFKKTKVFNSRHS